MDSRFFDQNLKTTNIHFVRLEFEREPLTILGGSLGRGSTLLQKSLQLAVPKAGLCLREAFFGQQLPVVLIRAAISARICWTTLPDKKEATLFMCYNRGKFDAVTSLASFLLFLYFCFLLSMIATSEIIHLDASIRSSRHEFLPASTRSTSLSYRRW